jgi:hypothetical protein
MATYMPSLEEKGAAFVLRDRKNIVRAYARVLGTHRPCPGTYVYTLDRRIHSPTTIVTAGHFFGSLVSEFHAAAPLLP